MVVIAVELIAYQSFPISFIEGHVRQIFFVGSGNIQTFGIPIFHEKASIVF